MTHNRPAPFEQRVMHGGRRALARQFFASAPAPFLDLSTGINPHSYPLPQIPQAVFSDLPDPDEQVELSHLARRHYGSALPPVVAPGSQAVLSLLPYLFPGRKELLLPGPTYGEYSPAWASAGVPCRSISSLEDIYSYLAQPGRVMILCNPNNPDGRRYTAEDILQIVNHAHKNGNMVIIDEAFADFDGQTVIPFLPRPGLFVLRSFGKAFGLAGVRLGFAFGDEETQSRLCRLLGSWPVGGAALYAGRHALADRAWMQNMKRCLTVENARLDTILQGGGLELVGGTSLFRLVRCQDAHALWSRLGEQGILVRKFSGRPQWLRFGLPGGEGACKRLEAALAACLKR